MCSCVLIGTILFGMPLLSFRSDTAHVIGCTCTFVSEYAKSLCEYYYYCYFHQMCDVDTVILKEMRTFRQYKNSVVELVLFVYNCCLHFEKM